MLAENRKVKQWLKKINCYENKYKNLLWWRDLKTFQFWQSAEVWQEILFHFVLAVIIDKQLFYEHEFKFTNLKFSKITNKINE